MKHSYCRSEIFRVFDTMGFLLTTLALLASCSSEIKDFTSEVKEQNETIDSSKEDTVLRFKTIEELENISIKDIPGDNDGFKLKELSYECVDTIELRAFRFDVIAKLSSSSLQERIIRFTAEVGPELVSVEYYPGGEMIPAHHNIATAFYPKVERYRNYSDGSRIGPDEFYDFGHFQYIWIFTQEVFFPYYPSVIGYDMNVIPWNDREINPDSEYYENGIFHFKRKYQIEHNLNTVLIEENGSTYRGEDFYNIIPLNDIFDEPQIREQTAEIIGNYSMLDQGGGYMDSYLYDDLDDETKWILELCSNVPDVSPTPFPKNTKSQMFGWYFGEFRDVNNGFNFLFSKHNINMDRAYWGNGIMLSCGVSAALQYLVIDNRIIHFDDIALKNYIGIGNIQPKQKISKISEGYLVTTEQEIELYGEKLKAILEIEMKGVSGPEETIDNSSYESVEAEDRNELNQLNSQTETTRSTSSAKKLIRPDGKRISIDCTLPHSLRQISKTRTLISTDR